MAMKHGRMSWQSLRGSAVASGNELAILVNVRKDILWSFQNMRQGHVANCFETRSGKCESGNTRYARTAAPHNTKLVKANTVSIRPEGAARLRNVTFSVTFIVLCPFPPCLWSHVPNVTRLPGVRNEARDLGRSLPGRFVVACPSLCVCFAFLRLHIWQPRCT